VNDLSSYMDKIVERIETTGVLDAPAALLEPVAKRITRSDAASRVLSGAPIGHRLHPLLTDLPIGAWTSAAALDLLGGRAARPAARRLVALGVLAAVPTALSGAADWQHTREGDRRVGVVHAAANSVGLLLQVASWSARRRGHFFRGKVLSAAALGAVGAGGYLGGHLVFRRGVGVDADVPVVDNPAWHVACRADELVDGHPHGVDVDGARVVLVRDLGRVYALAATCSHAGGPLDEGYVDGSVIECPWHNSKFRLDDGAVVRGPAACPQPVYQTRLRGDIVEIRHAHEGEILVDVTQHDTPTVV